MFIIVPTYGIAAAEGISHINDWRHTDTDTRYSSTLREICVSSLALKYSLLYQSTIWSGVLEEKALQGEMILAGHVSFSVQCKTQLLHFEFRKRSRGVPNG